MGVLQSLVIFQRIRGAEKFGNLWFKDIKNINIFINFVIIAFSDKVLQQKKIYIHSLALTTVIYFYKNHHFSSESRANKKRQKILKGNLSLYFFLSK